jgi:hypothetical protein
MDDGVHDHPKTVETAIRCGITREQVVGHISRLWLWMRKYRPNGGLQGLSDSMLAEASGWKGDPAEWSSVLYAVGFVKSMPATARRPMVPYLSGWSERNGRNIAESTRNRCRSKTVSRANPAGIPQVSRTNPAPQDRQDRQDRTEKTPDSPALALTGDTGPPLRPVHVFACVGNGPKTYPVTEVDMECWKLAYPAVDVLGEIRRMDAWLHANRKNRKTAEGMPRFVTRWLGKAQNQARPTIRAAPPDPTDSLPRAKGPPPTAEIRLEIERAVRAEHPEWGFDQVRAESTKRFNARRETA